MKFKTVLLLLFVLTVFPEAVFSDAGSRSDESNNSVQEHYGEPITLQKSVSLSEALQQAGSDNTPLLMNADVVSVCTSKGCWLGLTDNINDVRVTFKNYGFFVPPTLVGKNVDIQGTLKKIKLSLAETKHYVRDAGGNPEEVTKGKTEYQIVATGVRVSGE